MILFKRKKKETPPEPVKKPAKKTVRQCTVCSAVRTAGRSGEKVIKFVNGDAARVEIINESKVPGRMCYTLNIMNDPDVGWNEVPIKYCPWCGKSVRRPQK